MKIWIAYIVEENGKFYSYAEGIRAGNNLLNYLTRGKNLKVAHVCLNKKDAANLVTIWNDGFKANKTYLFDDPNLF